MTFGGSQRENPAEKKKYSHLLITHAKQSRELKLWEHYVHRHLEKFDRSDAKLCMGYAVYLYTTKNYSRAIKWSEQALELKHTFGTDREATTKIYNLFKLRALAAQKLWELAAKKTRAIADDADKAALLKPIENHKILAQKLAKEWLDFARSSNKNTAHPMKLCLATGDRNSCN